MKKKVQKRSKSMDARKVSRDRGAFSKPELEMIVSMAEGGISKMLTLNEKVLERNPFKKNYRLYNSIKRKVAMHLKA